MANEETKQKTSIAVGDTVYGRLLTKDTTFSVLGVVKRVNTMTFVVQPEPELNISHPLRYMLDASRFGETHHRAYDNQTFLLMPTCATAQEKEEAEFKSALRNLKNLCEHMDVGGPGRWKDVSVLLALLRNVRQETDWRDRIQAIAALMSTVKAEFDAQIAQEAAYQDRMTTYLELIKQVVHGPK